MLFKKLEHEKYSGGRDSDEGMNIMMSSHAYNHIPASYILLS